MIVRVTINMLCQFLHIAQIWGKIFVVSFLCQSRKAAPCFINILTLFNKMPHHHHCHRPLIMSLCSRLITKEQELLPLKAPVIHSLVIVASQKSSHKSNTFDQD